MSLNLLLPGRAAANPLGKVLQTMRMTCFFRVSLATLIALLSSGLSAVGQTNRGAIAGAIYDTTGAPIPAVAILARGENTGITYKTTSTSTGNYIFASVEVGTYDLTFSKEGFKPTDLRGVVVDVSATSARSVTLVVGVATTDVIVSGNAPTVQTQTSDVATVVTTHQVLDLPLIQGGQDSLRSPEAFVFLAPGAVGPGTASGEADAAGVYESKISGGQNFGTEIILDGADTYRSENGSSFDDLAPSVEAIQEFKVLTSTLPAAYGRTTGGVEIFDMKSGTNQFHGDAYDLLRNTSLNANTWFNNALGAKVPVDQSNDYGFTFGGPVWTPKVYDGHNKTFFFFSWEQFRQNLGATEISSVPDAAYQAGNFSSILGGSILQDGAPVINPCTGNPVLENQIFDPSTTRVINGQECRDPFPNNTIPQNRFSTVVEKILPLWPTPTNSSPFNNFVYSTSDPLLNTVWSLKGDEQISIKNHLSALFSHRVNASVRPNPNLPEPLTSNGFTQRFVADVARVNEDYTIGPELLNHITLGFGRTYSYNPATAVLNGINYDAQLGISGNPGVSNLFPVFSFGDSSITTIGLANNDLRIDNGLRLADTLSWEHGNHIVQTGIYTGNQVYSPGYAINTAGTFNFKRSETAAFPTITSTTGNAFASFLLGAVDNANISYVPNLVRYYSTYFAAFAQDDYKVTRGLTLNLGIRWNFETPRYEAKDRISSFDPNIVNPGAGGLLGALAFAGFGPGTIGAKNFVGTYMKAWEPRVGFAWTPSFFAKDKTVFRGGYAIYHGPLMYDDSGDNLQDGYNANPSFISSNSFDPNFNIDTGIPSFQLPPFLNPSYDNNGEPDYMAPSYSEPSMVQNWSVEMQRQLAKDLILSVGYVGEHATHLTSNLAWVNDMSPSHFSMGNLLSQSYNSPAALSAGITAPYPGFSGTVAQALRPYPQYFEINSSCCMENLGQSHYNALEVELQRRFRNGLNVTASYTYSKTITDADSLLPSKLAESGAGEVQDPFNHQSEKTISNQDIPQILTLAYLYQFPVGKGRKYENRGGPLNAVLGGWEVGAVQRYQSGQPFAFGCAQAIPGEDNCIQFNRVPGQPLLSAAARSGHFNPLAMGTGSDGNPNDSYFNKAFFQDPNPSGGPPPGTPYQYGDMAQIIDVARTPAFDNEDFSILKDWPVLREGVTLRLKFDFLNAFNRHVWERPNTTVTSPTFGVINSTIDSPRSGQFEAKLEF